MARDYSSRARPDRSWLRHEGPDESSSLPARCLLVASSLPARCQLVACSLPARCLLVASSLPARCLLVACSLSPVDTGLAAHQPGSDELAAQSGEVGMVARDNRVHLFLRVAPPGLETLD